MNKAQHFIGHHEAGLAILRKCKSMIERAQKTNSHPAWWNTEAEAICKEFNLTPTQFVHFCHSVNGNDHLINDYPGCS